jgi:hypothetical protein
MVYWVRLSGRVNLRRSTGAVLGAAILLSGCSFASDSLWPSLTGDEPAGNASEKVSIPPSRAEMNRQPTYSPPPPAMSGAPAPTMAAGNLMTGQPTGTLVGQKVGQLRGELQRLKGQLGQQNGQLQQIRQTTTNNAQRYHGTVAAVTARLQLGTTPGNPILVNQWNAAQAELDRISGDIATMNSLANQIASNSSLAAYVLESARAAYGLSGAIDEDHRQLALLEDETNRAVVLIDRLLGEINEDVARQTSYVAGERSNLTTLSSSIKNGELHGSSLMARAFASGTQPTTFSTSSTPRRGFVAGGRQALVVIRFDRPNVPYQQALYTAVSKTLQVRPDANFDLVAVTPSQGNASEQAMAQSTIKKHTNGVLKTLMDMGLPASRISLSASSSSNTASNEVHIYIR